MSDQTPHSTEPTEPDDIGGEDDSSTERNGDDSHLHEDQKSPTYDAVVQRSAGDDGGSSDDASKTQDLAKAGRADFDPNAGQE